MSFLWSKKKQESARSDGNALSWENQNERWKDSKKYNANGEGAPGDSQGVFVHADAPQKRGVNAKSDTASEIKDLSLNDRANSTSNRWSAGKNLQNYSNKRGAEILHSQEGAHPKKRAQSASPTAGKPPITSPDPGQDVTPSTFISATNHDRHNQDNQSQLPLQPLLNNQSSQQVVASSINARSDPAHRLVSEKANFISPSSPSEDVPEGDTSMFRQPETRAITQDQLVNEVKGIYAGLVMVEKKCVEIDQQQAQTTNKLSTEQWQALIALHRTLLHEHPSQHPSASPALRRLATKYAMPARMWRHAIHSFLELLRHRLPDSLDHMLAFVYLAYSMMALLMESVPSFLETWIECLGDLARYRMAIEEADLRDREIWSGVARMWYNKAADRSPRVGRIQHHLAVLARPNIVQQLFYYSKALVSVVPFFNARESVMLLFTPFLENVEMSSQKHSYVEVAFVKAHGILFTKGLKNDYIVPMEQFGDGLDGHIARTSAKFRVQGPEFISALAAATFDFGVPDSPLLQLFIEERKRREPPQETLENPAQVPDPPRIQFDISNDNSPEFLDNMRDRFMKMPKDLFNRPRVLRSTSDTTTRDATFSGSHDSSTVACQTLGMVVSIVCQRIGDKNILPFMHVLLAYLWSLAHVTGAIEYVEGYVPWEKLAVFLNTLGRSGVADNNVERWEFPQTLSGTGRQLPEDFIMRGLVWSQFYHPQDFFQGQVVDEDERTLELPSHAAPRTERCLWLGVQLATLQRWLTYDSISKEFTTTPFASALKNSVDVYTSQPLHTLANVQYQNDVEMTI